MRGRGISFNSPVNSGEARGHRSKHEVLLALHYFSLLNITFQASSVTEFLVCLFALIIQVVITQQYIFPFCCS